MARHLNICNAGTPQASCPDDKHRGTLSTALKQAYTQLEQFASAKLDAEILLAHLLNRTRGYLYGWPDTILSRPRLQEYQRLIERRAEGEPIAYLIGRREFWSMDLVVSRETLVPRPDTETLVEQALARIPAAGAWRIVDLGSGCGAIALAIASARPRCEVFATDLFPATLKVARDNVRRMAINNMYLLLGDWCSPLRLRSTDLIVCNPPYIAQDDVHLLSDGVRFEPRKALASGPDGLQDLRTLIRQATTVLRPGGWLLMEHGYAQGPAVEALLEAGGYTEIMDYPDSAGNPRVMACQSPVA
ncbi:MAG: peptide chain release factor N(5)-glutamine methyltransferase [Gammaproteobacteria bacterium]